MKERKDLSGYPEIEIRILDEGPEIIEVCTIDGQNVPGLRKIEISAPFNDIPIVKFEILGRISLKMRSKVHVIEVVPFEPRFRWFHKALRKAGIRGKRAGRKLRKDLNT